LFADEYVNSEFTMCYCSDCHVGRGDDDYYDRGQPHKKYGTPLGWYRIGLKYV